MDFFKRLLLQKIALTFMLCQVRGAKCSLPAKKDRGAGFSVLAAREIERELFHSRHLTLGPRSLLQNCTESLATQTVINRQKTV